MDKIAEIAGNLTEAQKWALDLIACKKGDYPAQLGAGMIHRPGAKVCDYKAELGIHKAQGLAFVGGSMITRLEKKALVRTEFGDCYRRTRLTHLGAQVRKHLNGE